MPSPTNDIWRSRRVELRRFVSKRVSDRDEAEDIVQDVMLRAHESDGDSL
ncbi:MAG TPA: sigma factor [Burkholderiaceae bacterium]|nr:sigma factor [Burkholderiaceae bacterium]